MYFKKLKFKSVLLFLMFIIIHFGYKQYRIYTIDCLTASLLDTIWISSSKDMAKLITQREEVHNKEIGNLQKRQGDVEKKLAKVDASLEEERKKQDDGGDKDKNMVDLKNDPKKNSKAPVKKEPNKKNEPTPSNPLEAEKLECTKELEKIKDQIEKYNQKLAKLKDQAKKLMDLGNPTIELIDKTGERKFCPTKTTSNASTFLTDKGIYYLARIIAPTGTETEEKVELIQLDGTAIRTIEEDEKYVDQPDIQVKGDKDKKKAPKKK